MQCAGLLLDPLYLMVSHVRKKVKISMPTNVRVLIPIKLHKSIDRFYPF
jgi:hypothetical protein